MGGQTTDVLNHLVPILSSIFAYLPYITRPHLEGTTKRMDDRQPLYMVLSHAAWMPQFFVFERIRFELLLIISTVALALYCIAIASHESVFGGDKEHIKR